MPKKILFTITGLAMGGAENQVVNLADELASRGYQIALAYILPPARVLPRNGKVTIVWLGGAKSFWGIASAYVSLVKLIRDFKPDVVHSHMFHANILSRLVRIVCSVPKLICTAHSNNEGGRTRMLAYRLTDRLANEFTNVSKRAVEAFEENKAAPPRRMLSVYNGVNTQHFRYNHDARNSLREALAIQHFKVFIAIGRFHMSKDYPTLLDAFSIVAEKHLDVHLLIVGDGDLRPQLERKIEVLGLQPLVTLLGIRNDIPELLSAADFFVLSSTWEGFGLVVAEAMACERVVIATDSGGVAEVVGDNGFLVAPRDSEALARSMQEAINMPCDLYKDYGQKSRRHICERYGLQAVVSRWEEIYRNLCE